jgi:hypothetical protein
LKKIGDLLHPLLSQIILRRSLLKLPAGVDQHDFSLAVFGFVFAEHDDDAGGAGVVEEVVGQEDDAVDEVLFDEPFADVAFLVFVFAAAAAGDGSGVENDGGTAAGFQRGDGVLQPGPVALAAGDPAVFFEALEGVVFKNIGGVCGPRRRRPSNPAKPIPSNPSVAGSGTEAVPEAVAISLVGVASSAVICAPWLLKALSISV